MKKIGLVLMSVVGAVSVGCLPTYGQEAMSSETVQKAADQLSIGESFQIPFTIAKGQWGSRSKDISTTATYTAPKGTVILGSTFERTGHHSWVAAGELKQADQISYDTGVVAELSDTVREGFLKGAFTWKGVDLGKGDAAAKYADFSKEFRANYRFFATTNSTQAFKWGTHTKTGSHGATINAVATITLQKVADEADASRALDVIKFALKSGQPEDLFGLMGSVFGGKKAADVGLVPAEPSKN